MRFFTLIPLSYITLFTCCKKGENETPATLPAYFAFGTAYGMCASNCATFYSLKENNIYVDDMERLTGSLSFASTPLPGDKYQKAKKLAETIPAYLIGHPDQTFGCPDCHDQGLIYIEYEKDNKKMHWKIDPDTDKQPQEIKNYIIELENTLEQLK